MRKSFTKSNIVNNSNLEEQLYNNISIAENVINHFKNYDLKSDTYIELALYNLNIDKTKPLIYKSLLRSVLILKRMLLSRKLYLLRKQYLDKEYNFPGNNIINLLNELKKSCEAYKCANCGEHALLAANYIINSTQLQNVCLIHMNIYLKSNNKEDQDHVFVIIDMDKNADLQNYRTWGNSAVIIDTWSGTFGPVNESIEIIKEYIGYEPDIEYIKFRDYIENLCNNKALVKNNPYNWSYWSKQ